MGTTPQLAIHRHFPTMITGIPTISTTTLPFSSPFHFSLFSATSRPATAASLVARAELESGTGRTSPDAFPSSPSSSPISSPKKTAGKGAGFGDSSEVKKKSRKRSVIRRSPIEKPSMPYPSGGGSSGAPQQQEQQSVNESAFLLTWLGLGSIILIEGIALAASGFLPEQWDNFFVKYLYPSFTPTVFLFVGGTVAYGVLKYLQGEQAKR